MHKLGTVCEHSCTLFSCAFEFSFTLLLENTLVPDFLLPADRLLSSFSAAAGRLDVALGLVARAAEPHKLLPEETQVCAVLCCAVLYVILLCICAQF